MVDKKLNILITGGNRGIGLELVRQYKTHGHNVYVICRQPSAKLKELDVEVFSGTDVANEAALQGVAEKLWQKLAGERIDVLINNAGILRSEILENLDFDTIREQFEINSIAPIRVSKVFLNSLGAGSKIIMVTSRMGSIADNTSGGQYGYRMSKAALNIAAVSLAHDIRTKGIAVGIIHPGYVKTDMTGGTGNITPRESARQISERIEELDLESSGTFWHANGEVLPW